MKGKKKQTQLHTSGKKEQVAEIRHVIILTSSMSMDHEKMEMCVLAQLSCFVLRSFW